MSSSVRTRKARVFLIQIKSFMPIQTQTKVARAVQIACYGYARTNVRSMRSTLRCWQTPSADIMFMVNRSKSVLTKDKILSIQTSVGSRLCLEARRAIHVDGTSRAELVAYAMPS